MLRLQRLALLGLAALVSAVGVGAIVACGGDGASPIEVNTAVPSASVVLPVQSPVATVSISPTPTVGQPTPTKVPAAPPATATPTSRASFAVGERVPVGKLVLTVKRSYFTMGMGPFEPDDGKKFLYVSVEVENPTDAAGSYDTVALTHVTDAAGVRYEIDLLAIGTGEEIPPSADVAPRTTEKGAVGFQVPLEYSGKFKFVLDTSTFGGGLLTVDF